MKTYLWFLIVLILVILTSTISVEMWGEKEEASSVVTQIQTSSTMTVAEFGKTNSLSNKLLKEVFSLESPDQLQNLITDFGLSLKQVSKKANKLHALESEDASKNWIKIPLKFSLWLLFLIYCFVLLRQKKINKKTRMILYGLGFTFFGVLLGADPSPMGTVKDAIVLYASKGVIFKPRLVAFTIFILLVIVANKFICAWGCQLGTLQDFIFRLNRNRKDTGNGNLPQFKLPFVVSNGVRIVFFVVLVWVAFTWAYDITHEIDPFKIFKPLKVSTLGWIFIPAILLFSLFTYRPWCHLFCPFGLTGWFFEKLSLFRIKVNYEQCTACHACKDACPSTVMGAILKRDKIAIPDCFSCGNCIETCPTDAISFAGGRNPKPPTGKF